MQALSADMTGADIHRAWYNDTNSQSRLGAVNTLPASNHSKDVLTMAKSILSPLKRCTKCGTECPRTSEYFPPRKDTRDKLGSWCRKCVSAQNAARLKVRRPTPEFKEKRRKQDATPKAIATRRRYYNEHYKTPEYLATRRERSKDPDTVSKRRERAARPEIRERQREHDREYGKTYRQTAKYKATRKDINTRRKQDPKFQALIKVAYQKRQARKRQLPDTLTTEQWQSAVDYFNGCCAVCGRQLKDLFGTHTVSVDHWIPLTNPQCPGTTVDNCIPLCHGEFGCNGSKNNHDPVEWLESKFGKRKAKQILQRIETYFESVRTVYALG